MRWQKEKSQYIVNSKWLALREDAYVMANGNRVEPYYVIENPDWNNIVAITKDKEVVLIRQFRAGTGRIDLELPCGGVENFDPSPMVSAKRELLEETGYTSDNFIPLYATPANPARATNNIHAFLALDAYYLQPPELEETEDIEVVLKSISEVNEMIDQQYPFNTSHLASLLMAFRMLKINYGTT